MQLTPCNSPTLAFHFQAQMSNGTICTTMQFVAYNYASAFSCLNGKFTSNKAAIGSAVSAVNFVRDEISTIAIDLTGSKLSGVGPWRDNRDKRPHKTQRHRHTASPWALRRGQGCGALVFRAAGSQCSRSSTPYCQVPPTPRRHPHHRARVQATPRPARP